MLGLPPTSQQPWEWPVVSQGPPGPAGEVSTVQLKESEIVYNAKLRYGAIGNGIVNDSAAIQTAINAASAAGGGTVWLTPGLTFPVSGLVLKTNVTLTGGGKLSSIAGSEAPMIETPETTSGAFVTDVEVDGTVGKAGSMVKVGGTNNTVNFCNIHNGFTDCVQIQPKATNIQVLNNKVTTAGRMGITVQSATLAEAPDRVLIQANNVSLTKDAGLGIVGIGKRVSFLDNTIYETVEGDGIAAYNRENEHVLARNNTIRKTGNHGIHLGGFHLSAIGNDIDEVTFNGILFASDPNAEATAGEDDVIVSNVIRKAGRGESGGSGAGIQCVNRTRGTCAGNSVTNPYSHCSNFEKCSKYSINGNTLVGSQVGKGIRGFESTLCVVTGNTAEENLGGGAPIEFGTTGGNFIISNRTDEPASILAPTASMVVPFSRDVHKVSAGVLSGINTRSGYVGRLLTFVFEGITTVEDTGNIQLAGPFVSTAEDTITLRFLGATWYEVSRSVN